MPMADPQTTSPPTLERADLRAAQAQEAIEKLEATFIAMTHGVIAAQRRTAREITSL